MKEHDEEQAKRETVVRTNDEGVIADCLNRRIGDKDSGVKLSKLSLLFKDANAVPDYIIRAAIKMTLIRVQDDARRTMTSKEIVALDGTTIDAEQFWAARSDRKARTVRPISFEKAQEAIAQGTVAQQADLLRKLLASNPELASLLKQRASARIPR